MIDIHNFATVDKFRPCPRCGLRQNRYEHELIGVLVESSTGHVCDWCGLVIDFGWNIRPVEDALRVRANSLENKIAQLLEKHPEDRRQTNDN